MIRQLSLPFDGLDKVETAQLLNVKPLVNNSFSHNGTCDDQERVRLEQRYEPLLEEADKFSRRIVSFQANKVEMLHNWIKYREGFSAQLIEVLFAELEIRPGQHILDPFAGSCTTLLEAKLHGVDATGIELLPNCHLAWEAKSRAFKYDIDELYALRSHLQQNIPNEVGAPFPHLNITDGAFPLYTEKEVVDYAGWLNREETSTLAWSNDIKVLYQALLMAILEDVSYTRKDGQYLRWDGRATKIIERNKIRITQGKKPMNGIDKGELLTVKKAILHKLDVIIHDVEQLQKQPPPNSHSCLKKGNNLYILPTMESSQFDGVITSPPYANRYDYTRTYALELAFLNIDAQIFNLRQSLLSCTVENRSKEGDLKTFYSSIGRADDYNDIWNTIQTSPVLDEVNRALEGRNQRGEINNRGVLRMIKQYFAELTFIYAELYRVCRSGAGVVFVNDNVRYAGEVVPVDTISTHLAESVGFQPEKIYVLPQRKGNSSQQMGKFGRRALRKSITIWRKP